MSSNLCIRCLNRSVQPGKLALQFNGESRAAFTTTAALARRPAQAAKKPGALTGSAVGKRLVLAKRSVPESSGKKPGLGERKAMRKRIVLSNTNALEVPGLQDLTRENVQEDGELEKLFATVMGLGDETVDALRALGMFKPTQAWHLFRRPATVIRAETLSLARLLSKAEEHKWTEARLLFGERGSGKSVLLLQAAAIARLRGWVVIHFPEARDLVNSHTSYAPSPRPEWSKGKDGYYLQSHYAAQLLGSIVAANRDVLSRMQLSQQHELPIPVQDNMSLDRFAQLGADDAQIAWIVWLTLWKELVTPSVADKDGFQRPPVMVGLDGLHHTMRDTAYFHPDMRPVHAHDLALIDFFTSLCARRIPLPNGGLVLGATSGSDNPAAPTLEYMLLHNDFKKRKEVWDPYIQPDLRVQDCLRHVRAEEIRGIGKTESRAIMEYYAQSGILGSAVTDTFVNEKWSLAGGGIVAALERSTVRSPYMNLA